MPGGGVLVPEFGGHGQAMALGAAPVGLVRRKYRSLLKRVAFSSGLPFEWRVRVWWRYRQGSWWARQPVTFNDKVRWRVLKDRRPLLTTFADKVAVRQYVADTVGSDLLPKCYAVVADPAELDLGRLPAEFVVKPSHGQGWVWIVSHRAPAGAPLVRADLRDPAVWESAVMHPADFDRDRLHRAARSWLGRNYGLENLQWGCVDIPPRLMVEELLRTSDGPTPADYKFFVFDGKVRLIQFDTDRFTEHGERFYAPDWTPLEVTWGSEPPPVVEAPSCLGQMVDIAQSLGRGIDFVRVDLYDVDGRVVFGELSPYPAGGKMVFNPVSFDRQLGCAWTVPSDLLKAAPRSWLRRRTPALRARTEQSLVEPQAEMA